MKKNFPLHDPRKADARVLDAIKHEIRKYVQRERAKKLPEGFGQWNFAARVGAEAASAEPKDLKGISAALDAVAKTGVSSVYVEIVASPGQLSRA